MSSSRWAAMGTYATTELQAFRRRLLLGNGTLDIRNENLLADQELIGLADVIDLGHFL